MSPFKSAALLAASALALTAAGSAAAQNTSGQEVFGQVLGALLGQTNSLDSQWLRGARPLSTGRAQFQARLDADLRSGAIGNFAANRLRADYDALVALETSYAADGRFSTTERTELNNRYAALTQSLEAGGPANPNRNQYNNNFNNGPTLAQERAEFEARINAAVAARRITRTQATALRADYQALVQTEAAFAADGINRRERAELDARLDALDARLGDSPSRANTVSLNPRDRLAALDTALANAERAGTVSRAEAAEIRVQHGDLVRLEAAYARTTPPADGAAYLSRRIADLEARARVSRR